MNQGVGAYKTKCLFEGKVTEESSTYLQYLRLDKSPEEYELIKKDYLPLANGEHLSEEDPFFPQRSHGRRIYRRIFSYFNN
jgi:hypothetical protein